MRSTRRTRNTRKGRNFEDNNTRLRTNVKAVGRFTKRGRADSNITANHEVRKRAKGTDTMEDVAEVATKEATHDFGYSLRELKTASSFVKEKFLEASGVLMIPSTFTSRLQQCCRAHGTKPGGIMMVPSCEETLSEMWVQQKVRPLIDKLVRQGQTETYEYE
ncbi:hypothetical protein CEUSTIGMA_g13852.t1 [Chlamydomonas eustigma]|uniref:Uncharacterized protein n=1 Tax=Chlamydomonas eustigma TaxID=1157962 RepID=A0A250XU32_9CHLO|nr:hypothetical protein CEUSTIGMA_g13852.t1 [Chlamydomonas eustigma]|eukprot:GAX86442.1 hypothetical protein CEUSTIGMA_g13852.t1 [Chlamydomonas eustigma]